MRLRAHAGALQRRLNTAAMPLPIEARNGRTAPPLGCKEKRHWPARRQAAGSASLMMRYRCRAVAGSSHSRTPATTSPSFRRPSTAPQEWQAAVEALILVATLGGPTMFARIGVMRPLNRHVERVFNLIAKSIIGAVGS